MNPHFTFQSHCSFARWTSYWDQINTVISLSPSSILEIGCGSKIFSFVLHSNGFNYTSLDIDPANNPDVLADLTELPFDNNSFECSVAFQVLEHMPLQRSIAGIQEMKRVTSKYLVISLPNQLYSWHYYLTLPLIGVCKGFIRNFLSKPRPSSFDGCHYWEVGNKNLSFRDIISIVSDENWSLVKEFRSPLNSYHHFFVFSHSCIS